ncbi:MAG: class I SAM-dependent methyltransferase [Opitutaceae bacterium]|nr:class I SAM-dependent methyltransferase [Opitutaceae bacterium]
MKISTERFSDRVENYVRYRPSYPEAVVETLIDECCLGATSLVADLGSGTGIFTRHLLDKQLRVMAVEPNEEMRQAAVAMSSGYDRFTSINGSAEESTLKDASVDLIVAAQAFHWFRHDEAQTEFARILKPDGWIALVWNERNLQQGFQKEYDALLHQYVPEYGSVDHRNVSDEVIAQMLSPEGFRRHRFDNFQLFDQESFFGRMRSSSYTPSVETPEYATLLAAAERLFAKYEKNGKISFEYETQLYVGKLKSGK